MAAPKGWRQPTHPDVVPARNAVLRSLRTRNSIETWPFVALVDAQTALVTRSTALMNENKRLKSDLTMVQQENSMLRQENTLMKQSGGNSVLANEKIAQLQAKLEKVQEELTHNYKTQSGDKDEILTLSKELQYTKGLLVTLQNDLASCTTALHNCERDLMNTQTRLGDASASLEVSGQELKLRQDEIDRLREALRNSENECRQLTTRYLELKEKEAERMNEIAQMYEDARALKASAELLRQARDEVMPGAEPGEEEGGGGAAAAIGGDELIGGHDMKLGFTCKLPSSVKKNIVAHSAEVHTIAHNSTGAMLLTGSEDRTVKLWDSRSGCVLATFMGAVQAVMCVDFSSEGTYALGTSNDNAIRLWGLKTGRVQHTLTGHMGKIYSAKFTADSLKVVSGSYDRTLRVWDLSKGYCVKTLFCNSSCNDLCLSPDNSLICSGHLDFNIRFWDVRTGDFAHEVSGVHSQPITSVCLVPTDGNYLLTHSRDDTLKLVDIRKYEAVRTFKSTSYRNGVHWNRAAISPDGQFIAAGSADGMVHVWNLQSGKEVAALSGHKVLGEDILSSQPVRRRPASDKELSALRSFFTLTVVEACSWGMNDQLASVDKDKKLILWE